MAFTPLDPTKAEVRLTGEAPNQGLDFYIPRGAKGEPGGITYGTILGATDLNDVRTPGVYTQLNGSATILQNYPVAGVTGTMTVLSVYSGTERIIQEFTPVSWVTMSGAVFYRRSFEVGNGWKPWRAYASQRTSEAAGRAIYTWDEVNNREQIIWGDTGWRDISGDLLNGATGTALIRRIGNTVTFRIGALKLPSANVADVFYQCPTGFVTNLAYLSAREDVNTGQFTNIAFAGSVFLRNGTSLVPNNTTHRFSGSVTMMTDNVWPTTLPGIASGAIPNT